MSPASHQCPEEKVAHNSPLLRRVTAPFSNRTVVDNFQEDHAASRRLDPDFTHRFCGGGCFQKDILNLVYLCEHFGLPDVARYWNEVIRMNDWQKSRFSQNIVHTLFNTVSGKKIGVLGFAFKKDTNDTRESGAIYVVRDLLMENAHVNLYDPKVPQATILADLTYVGVPAHILETHLHIATDALSALEKAHAMVVLTEWDEFGTLDFTAIYEGMLKPAFAFDGRNILPVAEMRAIGFELYCIGQG